MKLLLDECTPWRLKREFIGHEAFTVEDAGFKGLKNGRLLEAASGHFDVLSIKVSLLSKNCRRSRLHYRFCVQEPIGMKTLNR